MSRIFFSWQSDVAQNATTKSLRTSITRAVTEIEKQTGIKVIADEATRDVAGAPYIPGKIAEKIRECDIFIGDITSIAISEKGKSLPNPNVVFELGLAVAYLGWDRSIIIFNEGAAKLEKLPFDFDRHRISRYIFQEGSDNTKAAQKTLDKLILVAIQTIIEKNPLRPRDLEGKSEKEIKHDRDVENLKWFFKQMSIDLLGQHVHDMPNLLHYHAPVMYDGLSGVLRNPSFNLYDKSLQKKLQSLVRHLGKTLEYDGFYRELNQFHIQAFGQRGPHVNRAAELAAAAEIKKHIGSLARNLNRVVDLVRNAYIEVDLDETSAIFRKEYRSMIKNNDND